MTEDQKIQIGNLRAAGFGYKKIAEQISVCAAIVVQKWSRSQEERKRNFARTSAGTSGGISIWIRLSEKQYIGLNAHIAKGLLQLTATPIASTAVMNVILPTGLEVNSNECTYWRKVYANNQRGGCLF